MIHLKLNGLPHTFPSSWDDVTFEQYLKLITCKTDGSEASQILAIMLDYPLDQIKQAKIEGLEVVMKAMQFLTKTPIIDEEPIKLGAYTFPERIEFETVEQFEDVRSEITRVSELDLIEQNRALALYAAIYLQKPYDSERAKVLAQTFYSMPCQEVMSAGSFFSAKCLNIVSGLEMNYLRRHIQLRKRRRGFWNLARRLDFTRLWTR